MQKVNLWRENSVLIYFFLFPLFFFYNLYAEFDEINNRVNSNPSFPVDISFLIADLTYSQQRGIKICEIQQGILSSYFGDQFSNGNFGHIAKNFHENLLQYPLNSWAIINKSIAFQIRSTLLKSSKWITYPKMSQILNDPNFINNATLPVSDPYTINSYHGFLFVKPSDIINYKKFKKEHPGIIVLDASTFPFWVDKYKMGRLFTKHPLLTSLKPKWKLYPKKFTSTLAAKIADDFQDDVFVIKPRGAFLGHGVIIVEKENLEKTLEYILNKSNELKKDSDKAYSYWAKDPFDSFLVEQFVPSDPLIVPHLQNKIYRPTMRIAFLLIYNENLYEVKFLGGYWGLPSKSITEEGSLNQKFKTYCDIPYYCKVDPETMKMIEESLKEPLIWLHKEMLSAEDKN